MQLIIENVNTSCDILEISDQHWLQNTNLSSSCQDKYSYLLTLMLPFLRQTKKGEMFLHEKVLNESNQIVNIKNHSQFWQRFWCFCNQDLQTRWYSSWSVATWNFKGNQVLLGSRCTNFSHTNINRLSKVSVSPRWFGDSM